MIPNFLIIPGTKIVRCGQPETPDDWKSLGAVPINRVIKLNTDSEFRDEDGCASIGAELFRVEIDWIQQIFTEPDLQYLIDAAGFIEDGTAVHCLRGIDRTGLVIALWRLTQGWTIAAAESEWRSFGGDNPFLPGLEKAWADLSAQFLKGIT